MSVCVSVRARVCVIRECRASAYAPDTLDKVASGSGAPHHHSIERRRKKKKRNEEGDEEEEEDGDQEGRAPPAVALQGLNLKELKSISGPLSWVKLGAFCRKGRKEGRRKGRKKGAGGWRTVWRNGRNERNDAPINVRSE